MKVFVTTSDWYNPLLPAFAHLFNRFWPASQEVVVLCYSDPGLPLPPNFSTYSLGDPGEFGNDVTEWSPGRRGRHFQEPYPTPRWTDSLKRWTDHLADEMFILLQIDYFIHEPVNLRQIELLEKYLRLEDVVKIDLSADRFYWPHRRYASEDGFDVIVSDQNAPYRSSLQAAIWKRDYLASVLKPGRSPWDFERAGTGEQMNDGKLILGVAQRERGPVPYLNVYGGGRTNWRQLRLLDKTLLSELFERGMIGPHWNGWEEPW
jgi:hypothetical protein